MYYFTIGAIFKNEAHILKEWILHYLSRGVQHIFLINDNSNDNFTSILTPFINDNKVTLYNADTNHNVENRQVIFYNMYFKQHAINTKWFGIFDLDEFLYSSINLNLCDILLQYEDYEQISIRWIHFGSNHHLGQPDNVCSSFLYRGGYNSKKNGPSGRYNSHKSIIQCTNEVLFHVHSHSYSSHTPNTYILPFEDTRLLLNHYAIQSVDFWENIKAKRGDVNLYYDTMNWQRNTELFNSMDNNEFFDNRLMLQNIQYKLEPEFNFKCILSIGMRCFSEIYLKNMGYKKFSCIFDAAFMRSIDDTLYILENGVNYDDFIYTELMNDNEIQTLNKQFGNRSIHKIENTTENKVDMYHQAMYPHYNFKNTSDWEHMKRCIKRFHHIKSEKIRTLFFLCVHPNYYRDYCPTINEIEKLSIYLQNSFNCHLLVIYFNQNNKLNNKKWFCIKKNKYITIVNVSNFSEKYEVQKDCLQEIFSFYNIDNNELISYEYFQDAML